MCVEVGRVYIDEVRDRLKAESLVIENYRDQNLPFRKFQPEKRAPENSR